MISKTEDQICINTSPKPVNLLGTEKILNQMKYSVCLITLKNKENKRDTGSGFFCQFLIENHYTPTLITNHHVISKNNIYTYDTIHIKINNNEFCSKLKLSIDDFLYCNEQYDISIIKLKKDELLPKINFLEFDEKIFENDSERYFMYKNKSIYNISYPNGKEVLVSYGLVKSIGESNMDHLCSTEGGSSGSPILNLENNKVIGIHTGGRERNNKSNISTFLKEPINELKKKYNIYSTNFPIKKMNSSDNYSIEKNLLQNKVDYQKKLSHDIIDNKQGSIGEKKVSKPNHSLNQIKLTLFINKENLGDKILFMNNDNYKIEAKINNEKSYSDNYFSPKKEGYNSVVIQFKKSVIDCKEMFMGCSNIIEADLTCFNAREVTDMTSMFQDCSNLKKVNLSYLNTKKVRNMEYMFLNCFNLTDINLKALNTSNVINMHEMFYNCQKLNTIDLSSFNFDRVNNLDLFLYNCKELVTIIVERKYKDLVGPQTNSNKLKNIIHPDCYNNNG